MHRYFYYALVFLLILGDIFLFRESSDIRIFGVLLIYGIFIKFLKLKSNTTLLFSLILLVLAYIEFILFSNPAYFLNPETAPPASERTAVWAFLLLVVGLIQKWKE